METYKKLFYSSILFFLFAGTTSTFAQNKTETENWIVEKCKNYAINNYYTRELKIENGFFTYYEKIGDTWFYERILIKEITEVLIKREENSEWGYTIKVFCKRKGCNDSGKYINGIYKNTVIEYSDEKGNVDVYLNKDFGSDDLPKRMEKAIIHLVSLYGGNAKVYKEAF